MDAESAPVAGPRGQGAAERGDAFPHADEAVPVPVVVPVGAARPGARAVVEHGDLGGRPDPYDAHLGPGARTRVLAHVGQGLLDDPVGREVDRGGQRAVPVGAGQLDGEPGVAEGVDQAAEDGEPGGRLGGGLGVAGLAQQPDGGPQLVERGATGLAYVRERLLGLVRALVHDMGGHPGLDVDQGDVVGDDVVQVAGDAQPLLGDPAAGLLLAGALRPLGPFPDRVDERAPAAHGVPGGGGQAGPGEDADVLLAVPGAEPTAIAVTVSTTMVSRPTRQVVGRSVLAATVKSAMTELITTGAGGSISRNSRADSTPVTASTATGLRRRSTSAPAPSTIRTTLKGAGVRTPKTGPWPGSGSANDAQTMAASTETASAPSRAKGWPRSQRRARTSPVPRVVTSSHGTACRPPAAGPVSGPRSRRGPEAGSRSTAPRAGGTGAGRGAECGAGAGSARDQPVVAEHGAHLVEGRVG